MAGVDAQLQAIVDRVAENPFHFVLELDVRAGVLVENRGQSVLDGDCRSSADSGQQHVVVVALQPGGRFASAGGRASFVADHVDHNEKPPAQCGNAGTRDLGDLVDVVVTIAIVHRFEDVRAGHAQAASAELGAHPLVVVGQVPQRPELAEPIPGLTDLVEDLFPRRGARLVGQVDAPRHGPVRYVDSHRQAPLFRLKRTLSVPVMRPEIVPWPVGCVHQ